MSAIAYWTALSRVHGIGSVSLKEIHSTLEGLELSVYDLFGCSKSEIISDFRLSEKLADGVVAARALTEKADEVCISLSNAGIQIIPFFDTKYPKRITALLPDTFPPFLYVLGNADIPSKRGAAVLGDSEVSPKGEAIAFSAAKDLALRGLVMFSGMAKGAETAAHRAALINGGSTAAVLPCGMNYFKPPQFLANTMSLENTAIVSPFYPDEEPNRFNAFVRNRLICAMSRAVFIVEAPEEGGIFEAAKSAHKLNVPLYTAVYSEYPKNAKGNKIILEELGGIPILRRKDREGIEPNTDRLVASAKFD